MNFTQITMDKMREEWTAPLQKTISYLEQENFVLHEKLRKLEIKLAAEREACAKVAGEYRPARKNGFDFEDAFAVANSIAALIRGRG